MTESLYSERCADFDENYKEILENIARAAVDSGRKPEEITLLAATKTVPVEVINHAIGRGLSVIGENRVQELLDKFDRLDRANCDVQFIGRLQTNKVKFLPGKVSCIQSVDSVKLAQEVSRVCETRGARMDVLVEVNIGREEEKGGVMPEELLEFVDQIRTFDGITVQGLMAIPPICGEKPALYKYFSSMQQYFVDIRGKRMDNVFMDCLSMGMSEDYREAILCGATMVRIGSALFGKRG